jgi:hypothetical protein
LCLAVVNLRVSDHLKRARDKHGVEPKRRPRRLIAVAQKRRRTSRSVSQAGNHRSKGTTKEQLVPILSPLAFLVGPCLGSHRQLSTACSSLSSSVPSSTPTAPHTIPACQGFRPHCTSVARLSLRLSPFTQVRPRSFQHIRVCHSVSLAGARGHRWADLLEANYPSKAPKLQAKG